MPRFDQTGPRGQGKMTGRQRGNCEGGFCETEDFGRGNRGNGRGCQRHGRGYRNVKSSDYQSLRDENEMLKARIQELES